MSQNHSDAVVEFLKECAILFEEAPHLALPSQTLPSYAALKQELLYQYHTVRSLVKVEFTDNDPYATSKAMFSDIALQSKLQVYFTNELPVTHPLNKNTDEGTLYNNVFRAVHDYFGHYVPGNSFSMMGEFKAAKAHARMFTKEALPALLCETVYQNAWYHFSEQNSPRESEPLPIGANGLLSRKEFAPQKAVYVPDYVVQEFLALEVE